MFTMRIAVNGSETDTDVEADSAQWLSKVANVRISGGGGNPVRSSSQWGLDLDVAIPVALAAKIRTVTIAVQGPWTGAVDPSGVNVGGTEAYRIVFHGPIHAVSGGILDGFLHFAGLDEMWNLMQRKARTSASAGSGVQGALTAIETAHGLTMIGADGFPDSGDTFVDGSTLMQMYRPDQKDTLNGAHIAACLAGTGVNLTAEWDGTLTAPELCWRPDYFYSYNRVGVNLTRQGSFSLARPELWNVPECGYNFQDYASRFTVNGADSGGTRYYGWARLDAAADRTALGNRELSLTGYWNTAARCKAAALTVFSQIGYPASLLPRRITHNVNYYQAGMAGWPGSPPATKDVWRLATAMLGDEVTWVADGDYEALDGRVPAAVATDLRALFDITGHTAGPNANHAYDDNASVSWHVSSLTRTWEPGAGWTVDFGLWPDLRVGTDTTNDAGSGSY